mgnify:CR=1 FL=1
MTINTFEKVLLLPKHEKITASIVWKSGAVTEKGRITNEGKSIFIYNRGSKKYGTRIKEGDFLREIERIEIKEKRGSEAERWLKSWKKAEKMLEESGLWSDVLQNIKDGIEIGFEKIVKAYRIDFGDLPKTEEGTYQEEQKRKEQLIGEIDERLKDLFIRWHMSRPAVIKKMNFGYNNEAILEEIKQALKEKKEYSASGRNKYDISFNYSPEFNKAWYSEEYRNCGNGHYYLALNATHALFYEDD